MLDVNFRLFRISTAIDANASNFYNAFECDVFPMTGGFISSDMGEPEQLIAVLESVLSGEIKLYEHGYNTHRIFASATLSIVSFPMAEKGQFTEECIYTPVLLYMLIQWKDFIEHGEEVIFRMKIPG